MNYRTYVIFTMFNMNKNSAPILYSHFMWKINGENKAATLGALLLTWYNCVVLQWRQKISFASRVDFAYEHHALKINNAHVAMPSN